MGTRKLMTVLAVGAFLASGWGVWSQREQLAKLRAEQAQEPAAVTNSPVEPPDAERNVSFPVQTASLELLRLRNRLTLLSTRQRELAGVAAEAEQLRRELAVRGTNIATGTRLPTGYMRKADARQAGYATPDNTVQTFLWAIQQRDLAALLQTLTPEAAQKLQAEVQKSGGSPEEFFKASPAMPGLVIRGREVLPDGSMQLQVEVIPGLDTQTFTLRIIDGLWKLSPF